MSRAENFILKPHSFILDAFGEEDTDGDQNHEEAEEEEDEAGGLAQEPHQLPLPPLEQAGCGGGAGGGEPRVGGSCAAAARHPLQLLTVRQLEAVPPGEQEGGAVARVVQGTWT